MRAMRSLLVPILLRHAVRHGAEGEAIAARAGVPFRLLDLHTWKLEMSPVPIARLRVVADEVAEALEAPVLGIDLALELPRGVYGVQEHAFRHAPTLGEAALRFVRYQRATSDGVEHRVERTPYAVVLTTRLPGEPEVLGPHLNLFYAAYTMRVVRELAGHPVAAQAVRLAHPASEPNSLSRLRSYFGTDDITFGAGRVDVELASELWDSPVASAEPGLLDILDAHAAAILPPDETAGIWPTRVRRHLRRELSGGPPTLTACATALGVTQRSLQRWLEEAGTTYRDILDELRQEEARRMVAEGRTSIDEITFLLGYADRRSFTRAFERWTGMSASAYRKTAPRGRT